MEEQEIIDRIRELYPEASIEASGENCNFEVFVVDTRFEGVSLLKRQQSILKLFSEELTTGKLHALGIKAKTPEQLTSAQGDLIQIS